MSQPSHSRHPRTSLIASLITVVVLAVGASACVQQATEVAQPYLRVDFVPEGSPAQAGWRADHGEAFDARRTYGWVDASTGAPRTMTAWARDRNADGDPRLDTFIHMQPNGGVPADWVVDVANGRYRISATVGDTKGDHEQQWLDVEGKAAVEGFEPSTDEPVETKSVDVNVADGRITVAAVWPHATRPFTKLISLMISRLVPVDSVPTTAPPLTTIPPTTTPPTTTPPTTTPPTTTPESPIGSFGDIAGFSTGGDFNGFSDADIKRELDGMAAAGAKWIRMPMNWASVEYADGQYAFARPAQIARWAQDRGLDVLANVSYTPRWARPSSCTSSQFCAPADTAKYARYMDKLVRYMSPLGVKHYEVWNEPNMDMFWKPKPDPAKYTDLLRKAYDAAKHADPSVTVVAGAFSPAPDDSSGARISPTSFVTRMYRAGAAGHLSAISIHPYMGGSDPYTTGSWNLISSIGPAIHATMVANGDGAKKIWGTETGYGTAGNSTKVVSPATQGRYLARSFELWATYPYYGPLFIYGYRDVRAGSDDFFENMGLVTKDFRDKGGIAELRSKMRETTRG